MPISATNLAARLDFWIRTYGQAVSVYRPWRIADPATGDVTEEPVALAGTSTAMLQMGQKARDVASEAGVDPNQACLAFFLSDAASLLPSGPLDTSNVRDRWYVRDPSGVCWLVVSRPNVQPFPTAIGVGVLLQRQTDKPAGFP